MDFRLWAVEAAEYLDSRAKEVALAELAWIMECSDDVDVEVVLVGTRRNLATARTDLI